MARLEMTAMTAKARFPRLLVDAVDSDSVDADSVDADSDDADCDDKFSLMIWIILSGSLTLVIAMSLSSSSSAAIFL